MAKQPFVPVSNVLRVRFAGLYQTAPWVNGFALYYTGSPPNAAQLATLATGLRTSWASSFTTHFCTGTSLSLTQVWDISSAQGANAQDATTVACTNAATTLLPVSSAVTVSWPVQDRWRGGHFRTYAPPRNIGDVTNGRTLTQATHDQYVAAFTAFRNSVNGLSLGGTVVTLCGVRYFPTGMDANGHPLTKTSGQYRLFNPPVVHMRLDTQRRRLGKELT